MRSTKFFFLFLIISFWAIFFNSIVFAKAPSKSGKMAKSTGLQPVFYEKGKCATIASSYGSTSRYDGSRRPNFRFGGRHGGIDLTLAEGTPILAIANGSVVNKGQGKRMEGNFLWLMHSPDDTGLPYWIFSKYQHLEGIPELKEKDRVTLGQIIGSSGKTGTTGGHYGSRGYPHLHLSILKNLNGEYEFRDSRLVVADSILIDPLLIYKQTNPKFISSSEENKKTVIVPYLTDDGLVHPEGAKIVWPVFCKSF